MSSTIGLRSTNTIPQMANSTSTGETTSTDLIINAGIRLVARSRQIVAFSIQRTSTLKMGTWSSRWSHWRSTRPSMSSRGLRRSITRNYSHLLKCIFRPLKVLKSTLMEFQCITMSTVVCTTGCMENSCIIGRRASSSQTLFQAFKASMTRLKNHKATSSRE